MVRLRFVEGSSSEEAEASRKCLFRCARPLLVFMDYLDTPQSLPPSVQACTAFAEAILGSMH